MKDNGTLEPSNRGMRETHRSRRIGAVLAGLLAIIILSSATDMVLHATRVFPPSGQPMSDALFLLAPTPSSFWRLPTASSTASRAATSLRGSRPIGPCSTPWRSGSWALALALRAP